MVMILGWRKYAEKGFIISENAQTKFIMRNRKVSLLCQIYSNIFWHSWTSYFKRITLHWDSTVGSAEKTTNYYAGSNVHWMKSSFKSWLEAGEKHQSKILLLLSPRRSLLTENDDLSFRARRNLLDGNVGTFFELFFKHLTWPLHGYEFCSFAVSAFEESQYFLEFHVWKKVSGHVFGISVMFIYFAAMSHQSLCLLS